MIPENLPEGATPIDPDEAEGLKIKTIETREELNAFEQTNITEGIRWLGKRKKHPDVLSESFVRDYHRRLFCEVWRWAGRFRSTEKNIGVAPEQIAIQLRNLLEDSRVWIDQKIYPPREIALRFHHRLVQIHCFANGNGRHARLMTDALCRYLLKAPKIDWSGGVSELDIEGEHRKRYIRALQAADDRDMGPLFELFPDETEANG